MAKRKDTEVAVNPKVKKPKGKNRGIESRGGASIQNNSATPSEIVEYVKEAFRDTFERKITYSPDDDDEFERRTMEYIERCASQSFFPTIEGWAMSAGVNRTTLWQWRGRAKGVSKRRQEFCDRIITGFSYQDALLALNRKIPEITAIFRSKNYYDMFDQKQVFVTPTQLSDTDAATLEQKYLDAVNIPALDTSPIALNVPDMDTVPDFVVEHPDDGNKSST